MCVLIVFLLCVLPLHVFPLVMSVMCAPVCSSVVCTVDAVVYSVTIVSQVTFMFLCTDRMENCVEERWCCCCKTATTTFTSPRICCDTPYHQHKVEKVSDKMVKGILAEQIVEKTEHLMCTPSNGDGSRGGAQPFVD